ncbi:ATP synthase subunit delta, mitochondrial [Gonapodya sp. JEL0774]|nr:ATP synthase subunit delta, mitochondrial [Gonapodya sp. JEL0774]
MAAAAADVPAGEKGKLTFTFASPHQTFFNRTVVQQLNVTTQEGEMGILADHVPVIEQLVPGTLEVFLDGGKREKYFVAGGFLTMNPDSTLNITAVEAVPVDQIDAEAARRGLDEAQRRLTQAQGEKDKAAAQIEVETYQALVVATK